MIQSTKHPSGVAEPSDTDVRLIRTKFGKKLKQQLEESFVAATTIGEETAISFATVNEHDAIPCGFAYASTYEVTSPTVQLMLETGLADGPYDGRVLVSLEGSWSFSQSLILKEAVYTAVSEVLEKKLGVRFSMYSVYN